VPPSSFLAARNPHQHADNGLAADNAEAVAGIEMVVSFEDEGQRGCYSGPVFECLVGVPPLNVHIQNHTHRPIPKITAPIEIPRMLLVHTPITTSMIEIGIHTRSHMSLGLLCCGRTG
jgi:hypothetical protein